MTTPKIQRLGFRIREALETADLLGAATSKQIQKRMGCEVDVANVLKFCNRAIEMGLMTANRKTKPMQFSPVDGWRDMIPAEPTRIRHSVCLDSADIADLPDLPERHYTADEVVASALRRQPNSVFALGGR